MADTQHYLRNMFELTQNALLLANDLGRYVDANPAAVALTGYSRDELLGMSVFDLTPPSDQASGHKAWVDFLVSGRQVGEYRLMRKDGSTVDIEYHAVANIAPGIHFSAITDITERKRIQDNLRSSEERYRNFIQRSSEGIWRFEFDVPVPIHLPEEEQVEHFYRHAYLAECNDAMARMWRRHSAAELIGSRLNDLLPRSDPSNLKFLVGFIRGGQRLIDAPSHEYDRQGNPLYFINNFVGVVENGLLVRVWGLQRDITERKALDAELNAAKEEAEAANRAKDHFIAALSHELRTPLAPILTTCERLERSTDLGPDMKDALALIRRNTQLEVRLVDDLLDSTRIARGKVELSIQPLDVHAAIQQVAEICEGDTREKNLQLHLRLEANDRFILGDSARLQQVFWNILKNSIKFTPSGGQITIRTADCDDRLQIEFHDTGIGIEPDVLPHIFEPFEQGEEAVTRHFGGLGLGLAISRKLIELHGGTVSAHSPGRGEGATFTVELTSIDPATAAPPPPASPPDPQRDLQLSILIVEDHRDTAAAMVRLLADMGHRLTVADSLSSALRISSEGNFDLIISDIGLPDGTGLDLISRLPQSRRPKAIALSGFGMDDDIQRSRDAGFAEHLTKPVDLSRLEAAINRVCGNS